MAANPFEPRSLCAIQSLAKFGNQDLFIGLRQLDFDEETDTPYGLAIDATTSAALIHSINMHTLSRNYSHDTVRIIGAIVGSGHPAQLYNVEEDGSLTEVREVDTTILLFSFAGVDREDADAPDGNVLLYEPRDVALARQKRRWWQFWRSSSTQDVRSISAPRVQAGDSQQSE